MIKIILYDINEKLIKAWERAFNGTDVIILKTSFEDLTAHAVVTAGNSYGVMSGGIDLSVREYYGTKIQDLIQHIIITEHCGKLIVGQSICVDTSDQYKKFLIYAPTMEYPQQISPIDIFYVTYKLLQSYNKFPEIAICGLGTCTGNVKEEECAKAMRDAYDYWLKNS